MCKITQVMPICVISSDCHKEGCGDWNRRFVKTKMPEPKKTSPHKAFILETDYYEDDRVTHSDMVRANYSHKGEKIR
jgi:hypothetical protein